MVAMTMDSPVRHIVLEPSTALRPFIKRFETTESFAERNHTLLPATSLVACFRLQGTARIAGASILPAGVFSGLQDRARVVTHLTGSHVLLAVFTETGAAAFLREPVDGLFNETMPVDCLEDASQWKDLGERLQGTAELAERIGILERFLLRRLRKERPDPGVAAVTHEIQRKHGTVRIEKLARGVGLSLSALERRFRGQVGSSPRKFASIVRMRHVLRLRRSGANLTEIAHQAGYFDQPHFIRDFRGFTGQAPESFFERSATFC